MIGLHKHKLSTLRDTTDTNDNTSHLSKAQDIALLIPVEVYFEENRNRSDSSFLGF